MSSSSSALGSRQLAIGAALLGCSLASTDALGGGRTYMTYTTVNSFTATMTAGSVSFTYTLPGASTYFYNRTIVDGINRIAGCWASGSDDVIAFILDTGPLRYTSASGSGTVSLTFSQDVTFFDVAGGAFGTSSCWEYLGSAVNDGDVFLASGSPYIFTINYSYSGALRQSFYSNVAFSLAAPAIPLPGAAGLAACGLLGLARRRRR